MKWQPKTSNVKTQTTTVCWSQVFIGSCIPHCVWVFWHRDLNIVNCKEHLSMLLDVNSNYNICCYLPTISCLVNKLYAYSLQLVDWTSQLTLSCVPYPRFLMLPDNRLYPVSGKRPLFTLNNHTLTSFSNQYTLADHLVHNLSFQEKV